MREVSRHAVLGLVAVVAAVAAGCEDERRPNAYMVTFTVESDPGEPLPGALVEADGTPLGRTGADGALQASLRGFEGTAVALSIKCPEGYRQPQRQPHLVLRTFKGLDPAAQARGIEVPVACPPELRSAAIVVRASDHRDLPVVIQGREMARTDASGVAHLAFRLPPGSAIRVALDTSSNEHLRPRNPAQTFLLGDGDEIFPFDPTLEVVKPPAPARRRVRPRIDVRPELPQKIKSHR